jgi:DHA2 family lincomycin resistance protein-like MFS transporter
MSTETIDTSDHLHDRPSTPPSNGAPSDPQAEVRSDKLAPGHVRVIALLMASAFTVILNETTMGVALPLIMEDLGITATVGQWLTTAFLLTMAVVIPATGFLINRLGTRGAYLTAMALFSAGTLIALLSPSFGFLVTGRVVQATGTAIMMPLLMTTIMTIVPPHLRGRIMGNITLVIALAPAMGPTVSGIIADALGWRYVFGIVLPIALAALVAGVLWIRDVSEKDHHPLDPLSLLLALVAFGGVVWGLSELGESARGETAVSPWLPLGVGVLVLGVFVWRQLARQRTDSALLDLRTFRSGNFGLSVGIMAIAMLSMLGTMVMLPLVLQDALGYTPTQSGLVILPGGLAMGLSGPFVGRLYDQHGPRPLMVPGLIGVVAGTGMLAFINPAMPWYVIVIAQFLLMLGLSFTFTPLFSAAMGELEPHLFSHGSAMINTVQQVAGAAGTALFVALLTLRSTSLADSGAGTPDALTGGASLAFTVGAGVLVVAVVLALLIKRVDTSPHGGH